jgi:type I restriction enzyme S subunit
LKHLAVALDELVTIVGGGTPSKARPEYFKGRIPWVSPKDMKSWHIVDSEDHITEEAIESSSTSLLRPGAVLVVIRSGILKHTLPVAINRVSVTLNQDMKGLLCGERVTPEYLARALQALSHKLLHTVRGTTADNIPTDVLRGLAIPLPPVAEQNRVAAILERADRLRRRRRYGLEMAEDLLPTAFDRLFGDPVVNPKRWKVVTVEEAGTVQLGRQRAPQYQTGIYRRAYMRVANVYEDRIDLSDVLSMDFDEDDFREYKLEYGDILLNEGQSTELVGRPAMWRNELPDCCFQNTLLRFQCNPNLCLPQFALWLFIKYLHRGEFAKMSAKTSNVAHLGAYRLAQMPFPIPPLSVQGEFAALVEKSGHLRAIVRESLRQAEHLFQTLLHRAFTGGL